MPEVADYLIAGDLKGAQGELKHLSHLKEQEWIEWDCKGSDLISPMALGEQQAYMKLGYHLGKALKNA